MDHLESLPLEGGGSLEYCVSDSGGAANWLFFHVGTPSAAVLFPHMTEAAARRGIRIVTYSRGGYGSVDAQPGACGGTGGAQHGCTRRSLGHRDVPRRRMVGRRIVDPFEPVVDALLSG